MINNHKNIPQSDTVIKDIDEQQFILESRTAFKSVKRQLGFEKQLKSAATLVGVLAILAIGALTTNIALKPSSNPVSTPNSLLVSLETTDGKSQIFRGFNEGTGDSLQGEVIHTKSLFKLADGDRVLLESGARATLLALNSQTRIALVGPCDLLLTQEGIQTLDKTPVASGKPIQGYLGGSTPPLSPPVYRNGPGIPNLVYPAQTTVAPGVVTLQWNYDGAPGDLIVVIENSAGNSVTNLIEIPSTNETFNFKCEPGSSYYWHVISPDGKSARMQVFDTLNIQEWKCLEEAARLLGLDLKQLQAENLANLDSVELLAMYELLLSYNFNFEANLIYQHLSRSEEDN